MHAPGGLRRSRILTLVSVLAVGGVTVIGLILAATSDDEERFNGLAERYQEATSRLQSESEALRAEPDASSSADGRTVAETLRVYVGLRAATERARNSYDALEVPSQMAVAKMRLVDLVAERVSVLRRLIDAAELGDQATVAQAVRDLVSGAQPIGAAQAEMSNLIVACGSACQ